MRGNFWLEAESFDTLGGWVIDQRSMAQMGSAYLMAHGMGIPVPDAETRGQIPADGQWTVWARTRDWTAPWKRGTSAGRFQVKINGAVLAGVLGTNGERWGWQKAGAVKLAKGEAKIALHDLTGFNGRCDALYFTTDPAEVPTDAMRPPCPRQDASEEYDLVVVGGGVAGICAALAAARTGSKVVLLHDRPVLGGCNSSEVRVGMGGDPHAGPYPKLGNVVMEIGPVMGGPGYRPAEMYEDIRKANAFLLPPSPKLVLSSPVVAVEMTDGKITAVVARGVRDGMETRYKARLFADCTGDAVVARLAGAATMYGREARAEFDEPLAPELADRLVMGLTVVWSSKKAGEATSFPDIDWGLPFNEGNAYYIRSGDWEWETGQRRDQAEETEYIRDYGLMVTYANWSFLKNHSSRKAEWAEDTLEWVSPFGGKRESYRIVGDHVLTQNDVERQTPYPDGTVAMNWNIDLHFPDPENTAKFQEPFRSCAYHHAFPAPYPVPYRCLYSRDVPNLFLGGRHLSVTHVAFAGVRVMRTLGALGEVVGMAASLCAQEKLLPRGLYEQAFDKLKTMMEKGIDTPLYHKGSCEHESYHFKELGHLNPADAEKFDTALRLRIKALGDPHLRSSSQSR